MAKITIDDITGQFTSVQAINDRFQQVEDELNDKVLYRNNPAGEPNNMSNDLDMNSNRILNLTSPTSDNEPARWADVKDGVSTVDEIVPSQSGNTDRALSTTGSSLVFKDGSDLAYDNQSSGSVRRTVGDKFRETVSVTDFGAVGDGSTDDSAAIQAAIDSLTNGGTVVFPMTAGGGDYRVAVTKGTNDKYGVKVTTSGISIKGEPGTRLRRQSSDISTFALAFPLLLVGVPDDNNTQITDVEITGLTFYGENARHTTSGAALMDGRQAIWLKNVKGAKIHNNVFENIDSGAIYTQSPGELDYENTQFYNTTKCYEIDITDNKFRTATHAVPGRALLHAVLLKCDGALVSDNEFFWCDVCVDCETTYANYTDRETDTFTNTDLGASVMRTGRGTVIKGNSVYNSSEHSFYLNGMNVSCSGNSITVDNSFICNTNHIQVRGEGVTVTGNTATGVVAGASISTGASDVSLTGNVFTSVGDPAGGVVNIQSQGLTSFITAADHLVDFRSMKNIVVADNVIDLLDSAQTNGIGIRIFTDDVDVNFPDGQMENVSITGNIVNRARLATLNLAPLARRININGNTFNGKSFIEAGFNAGTVMNSLAVLAVDDFHTNALSNVSFSNNRIYGFSHILLDDGGAGANMLIPRIINGNVMDYVQNWDTSAFFAPGVENRFRNNSGVFFLDRTGWFTGWSLENSLSDGTANSDRKGCILLVGASDTRIYYDDSGNFNAL